MITLSRERQGEVAVILSALLWALFPVVTILTLSRLTPLFSAALSTLISATLFAVVVTLKCEWAALGERRAWKPIALSTLLIGIIFYGLIFTGLKYTTAGNEAIITLMEVFFSFLILGVLLRHEKPKRRSIVGAACMIAGAALVLLPKTSGWHSGDLLVLLATAIAPIGNRYTQQARSFVSAALLMFCRSLLGGFFLLLLAATLDPLPSSRDIAQSFGFLAANGILFLGLSKILWIESVHRLPITKVVSLEHISPLFTLLAAHFVLREQVNFFQIAGLIPILAGVYLLTSKSWTVAETT